MARWRAEALKYFPDLQKTIASVDNVMALWLELHLAFEAAYQTNPRNEALIARVYAYADWCMQTPRSSDPSHDPSTAVALAFYEHIPACSPARDDMPRWFRYEEIVQDRAIFSYHIGDQDYNELLAYMAQNKHRYRPRIRASASSG